MSPAHVLEPTYSAIKRQLLSAQWEMGARLEAAKLADNLGVSITPVRDSLNRLFGEHMVDFVPGEGFRVPLISEGKLRDLLSLNQILLMAAAEADTRASAAIGPENATICDRTAFLFLHLAARTKNEVLIGCVASINDRLHAARYAEATLFGDIDHEFDELASASLMQESGRVVLKGLLRRYHDRRIERVADYVAFLSAR